MAASPGEGAISTTTSYIVCIICCDILGRVDIHCRHLLYHVMPIVITQDLLQLEVITLIPSIYFYEGHDVVIYCVCYNFVKIR